MMLKSTISVLNSFDIDCSLANDLYNALPEILNEYALEAVIRDLKKLPDLEPLDTKTQVFHFYGVLQNYMNIRSFGDYECAALEEVAKIVQMYDSLKPAVRKVLCYYASYMIRSIAGCLHKCESDDLTRSLYCALESNFHHLVADIVHMGLITKIVPFSTLAAMERHIRVHSENLSNVHVRFHHYWCKHKLGGPCDCKCIVKNGNAQVLDVILRPHSSGVVRNMVYATNEERRVVFQAAARAITEGLLTQMDSDEIQKIANNLRYLLQTEPIDYNGDFCEYPKRDGRGLLAGNLFYDFCRAVLYAVDGYSFKVPNVVELGGTEMFMVFVFTNPKDEYEKRFADYMSQVAEKYEL